MRYINLLLTLTLTLTLTLGTVLGDVRVNFDVNPSKVPHIPWEIWTPSVLHSSLGPPESTP